MTEEREVKTDQVWRWMDCTVYVRRVAKDKSWADIIAFPRSGKTWRKRQPLPMAGAVFVRESWR
jgi:hypothetical protein